ncbi:MAG: alpha/beta hydrolase [Terriglobales bacterium]
MAQLLADMAYGEHPRQRLDLFLPEKLSPRLLLFVHAGGWTGGDKAHYHALGELLCGFGYAVALPNHRLAPEYRYPAAIEDVAAATAFMLRTSQESGIRSDGILLGGHSSGGHLAALLAVHPRYQPEGDVAGVICVSGVYDLAPYYEVEGYLGPVFGPDHEVWDEASPLRHLAPGAPPFFLAYAEHDYPGAAEQAETMAEGLRRCGGHANVTRVPGRNHVTILTGVQSMFDPLAIGLAMFLRGVR